MTFGYWINMLGKDYEDVTHKTLLWPNLLTSVFPNTTHKPKRHIVETVFQRTRDLRNRLSHHEPIWKFYQTNNNGQLDYGKPIYGLQANLNLLQRAYSEMLQTIRWMSEDRYQSFLQAGLDTEFQRLCSLDGFYDCVTPQLKTVAFENSHSETNT